MCSSLCKIHKLMAHFHSYILQNKKKLETVYKCFLHTKLYPDLKGWLMEAKEMDSDLTFQFYIYSTKQWHWQGSECLTSTCKEGIGCGLLWLEICADKDTRWCGGKCPKRHFWDEIQISWTKPVYEIITCQQTAVLL